jgi:transcriptional regulator with XRE-family HTH domain
MTYIWRYALSFGEKLRKLREERGMSMRELSRKAELALSHVQYLENDARTPGETTIKRLAKALGVAPADLKTQQVSGQVTLLLSEVEKPLTDEQREEILAAVDRASRKTGSRKRGR